MRTASGLAMVVAMLLLLGVAGSALKLYMDRESMADMIDGYGQTLTALPVGSDEAAKAFASAAASARDGRFDEARKQLAQGQTAAARAAQAAPVMPGMPQLPGMGGGQAPELTPEDVQTALQGLPDDARPFFEKRPELFRRALRTSMAARQVSPEAWAPQREKILKAAAAGDEKTVVALLDEAQQALGTLRRGGAERGGRGGGPGGMPGMPGMPGGPGVPAEALGQAIAQARQMLAQARAAGLDTSKVSAIVDRADSELKAGNAEKAATSLREAFEVAREAMGGGMGGGRGGGARGGMGPGRGRTGGPRGGPGGPRPGMGMRPGGMRGGSPGMGMPPGGLGEGGGPLGMFPGIFSTLMSEMQRESGVLQGVLEDIDNAGLAMREKNQDQIREILGAARDKIAAIGQRRGELGRELQAAQALPQGAAPGGQGPGLRAGGQRPGGQRPGGQRPGGQRPGGQRAGMGPAVGPSAPPNIQRVHDVIGRALDDVRQIPDEEYEQQREAFIQRFVGRVIGAITGQEFEFSPGEGPSGRGAEGLPPIEVPAEEPTDALARRQLEDQIRNRLRMIQEPCALLAQVGADMTPVEAAVSQARNAVNAGRLVEAATATNQAADLVWRLVDTRRSELEALRQETEAQAGGASPGEQPKQ